MVRQLQKVTLPCGLWVTGHGITYKRFVASADDEFGIMPCPLTGKEDDAVNTGTWRILCSKGYCIDASQNA